MFYDVRNFRNFYETDLGTLVRRGITQSLRRRWPNITDKRLLGHGFATPFMHPWAGQVERSVAAMWAEFGAIHWPGLEQSCSVLVNDEQLPFNDALFDRVLMIHGLENSKNPQECLREVWRVMTAKGRMIIVAPNRSGIWASVDSTPFGIGHPFTLTHIQNLLMDQCFSIEDVKPILYSLPSQKRMAIRLSDGFEWMGRHVFPRMVAGAWMIEVTKELVASQRAKRRPVIVFKPAIQTS